MAYINQAYFNTYTTTLIDESEFTVLANRASDVIDMLTMHRIGGDKGFSSLPYSVQEAVRKATAAQLETLYDNGGTEALTGGDFASVTVGKFSYSKQSSGQKVNGIPVSPLVSGYLFPTRLLYRGL